MTEKRYDWIDEEEYNSYWIADLNKSDKTKEDFFDKEEGYYNIIAYEEYLENNDCLMNGGEVTERLNPLTEENQQLKEENQQLKEREHEIKNIIDNLETKEK